MTILSVMSVPKNAKRFYDNQTAVLFCGESTTKYTKNTVYIAKCNINTGTYYWDIATRSVVQCVILPIASKQLWEEESEALYLYIGDSNEEYTKNAVYKIQRSVDQNGISTYSWVQTSIVDDESTDNYMSMSELYSYWGIE